MVDRMEEGEVDYVFKIILIGDTGTGKSCILHHFIEGRRRPGAPKYTIGVEYGSRVVTVAGRALKLKIWDTAGHERFRSVTHSYYRNSQGAVVVYDITDRQTFEHVQFWCHDSRSLGSPDTCVVLAGNKLDRRAERRVDFLEASRVAQEQGAAFLETSAVSGTNIDALFEQVAKAILGKIEAGVIRAADVLPTDVLSPGLPDDQSKLPKQKCWC
jgi:Ras-related protein Rab-4B